LNKSNRHTGKVILAGAGPGDPDLITVKAVKALQSADVILADRLVSSDIIDRYVRPGAMVIEVGKQCRRGVSTPQETINDLMLKYSLQGKQIVRLKGGDISFFSNVLDELKVLVENEIPYELIPGVTAASGAAAYAGIPLTARGYAAAVRFVTYYKPEIISDDHWKELAQADDTLVFYMSSETLEELTDKLVAHGIDSRKKMAVIEQATTPYQQVHISPVHAYRQELGDRSFLSPSLVIIGNVVNLHETFQWFVSAPDGEHYFKPLTGAVESIINDVKKKYADRA
jgi:uroporphyrin-III C-methyltransferase